ncbi:MAG: NAD(P)-dependent oxidoreductase [Chloroflexota bacterium]
MKVGFIGLGAMGMPMTQHILEKGFPLAVWARRKASAQPLLEPGARWADSPKDLAETSDMVITMVTSSPDVRDVVLGEQGILAGASRGSIIVDMSTIAPSVSRELAQTAGELGVHFLDAPVSGGTQGAHKGTLSIMVGGEQAAFDKVLPVLEAMGDKVFHVGPAGSGEVIKLANNILVGVIAAACAEALTMGVKAGANLEVMVKVIQASAGASWQLGNQFPLRAFNGSFQPGFMTDLLLKDLDLALDLGGEASSPLFLTAVAKQLYGEAKAAGYGRDDYTSLLRVLEQVANIKVRT